MLRATISGKIFEQNIYEKTELPPVLADGNSVHTAVRCITGLYALLRQYGSAHGNAATLLFRFAHWQRTHYDRETRENAKFI
jgi:hypothetical protein